MKKNYRIKKICKETLPYDLKSSNKEKYKIINNLAIPKKTIIIKAKAEDIMQIKKIIEPYLKCFTYINIKDKTIIAYPDVLIVEKEKIKILLNYYHHHHMDRFIRKIKNPYQIIKNLVYPKYFLKIMYNRSGEVNEKSNTKKQELSRNYIEMIANKILDIYKFKGKVLILLGSGIVLYMDMHLLYT